MQSFLEIPDASHYRLCNARVPVVLLQPWIRDALFATSSTLDDSVLNDSVLNDSVLNDSALNDAALNDAALNEQSELVSVDIEIRAGRLVSLRQSGLLSEDDLQIPQRNLQKSLVWPCFVDMHTHLDKGHIWARSPNPDGTFEGALNTVQRDSSQRWEEEDVYRRAEFGLKCSYAHGTRAVRTHLDSFGAQGEVSFRVFQQLREAWRERIDLQAVCLVTLDYFMDEEGERLADLVASAGGILGGVAFTNENVVEQIDRVFQLAKERSLNLDFHTDESLNFEDKNLRYVADAAIKHRFEGKVTCGHCCSLSVQEESVAQKTIERVKAAGISVVSLPMCNLYLQGRKQGKTPRYRGVTVLHELKNADIDVAIASDNCRDPFFAYGDHDGLEVFTQSARIGHLDHPIGDWPRAITTTPAKMMGLANSGLIGEGMRADLVVFKARSFNELMSRRQCDRVVIRAGKQIDTTLPDYAELDDLMH